jgi:hypothetical protein
LVENGLDLPPGGFRRNAALNEPRYDLSRIRTLCKAAPDIGGRGIELEQALARFAEKESLVSDVEKFDIADGG